MGIIQSDLVLRSFLKASIADLRANPWILIDIFAQCAKDSLLQQEFGYAEIKRVTTWFLKTNIPVVMQHRMDPAEMPCITVSLLSSTEKIAEDVLGDYDTVQDVDDTQAFLQNDIESQPIVVIGPFTPSQYDPDTGLITLPDSLDTDLLAVGQAIVDRHSAQQYSIVAICDDHSFKIASNTIANFTDAIVVPQFPVQSVIRQRSIFDEVYQIGCHVAGDPAELLWLHTIITYCLLKYKFTYLEKRGLTRTTFSSSDFAKVTAYEPQNIYSRFVTMRATVENNWLESVQSKLEQVGFGAGAIKIIDGGTTNPTIFENEVKNQGWRMDDDPDDDDEDNLL